MVNKIECFKIVNRKQVKLPNSKCNKRELKKLQESGVSVARITTIGTKTKIETFSPLTREQAIKEHRKRFGNLAFN
jgi:hypothetical protein